MTSMFWGLRLEPGKRYTTTVGRSFHVSMAALDCASVKNENEVNSVMLEETESSVPFILCNLQKQKSLQCPLDLNFMTGDRITFFCKGNGTIHLSGYVHEDPDDDEYGNLLAEEEEEEDEEEDEEEGEDALSKGKKQQKANGLPGKRQIDDLLKKAAKKAKLDTSASPEDDSDSDLENLLESKDESDEEDEEEDEDEDEDEEDSEDEKNEVLTSPKQQKKKQLQQQKNKNNQSNQVDKQVQNLSKKEKKKGELAKQKTEASSTQKPQKPDGAQKKTIQGGVQIKDSRVGTGAVCKPGQKATVYYIGRLKDNNKVFDSARKGNGFTFTVGKGDVIKAWDVGVAGMKVGGKRTIICPPNMGYGQRGSPPTIPPNSTLVFEVELRNVK